MIALHVAVLLAQGSPEEFVVPFFISISVGLICGVAAVFMRLTGYHHAAAAWLGVVAIAIGLDSPILILAFFGKGFYFSMYLVLATPLVPGIWSLFLARREPPQVRGFPLD